MMSMTLRAEIAANPQVPMKIAVGLLRLSQALPRPLQRLGTLALWLVCSADIPARTLVGQGIRLPHGANGVVIHPSSTIGQRVTINHRVTLAGAGHAAPTVEDDAFIGAGAVVIGGVTLGAGCRIGANAVVLTDIPPGATAVGVPARVVPSHD